MAVYILKSNSLKQIFKTDLISEEKLLECILFTFCMIQQHFTNVVNTFEVFM